MSNVNKPKPDAYIFQHEETGVVHEVDAQQVEWDFAKNNPRLKMIGGLYSAEKMESYAAERVREALEQAAKTVLDGIDDDSTIAALATRRNAAEEIRALIPKE